jgi:hypothetical protein
MLRIANAGRQPRDLTLTIDIYAVNMSEPADGHYASLTKTLIVQPHAASTITIHYDWFAEACFRIDDDVSPPDGIWRGAIGTPQLYAVTALLDAGKGTQPDSLTVYQELAE